MAYTIAHKLAGQKVINKFLNKFQKYNGYSIGQSELIKQVTTASEESFINTLGSAYIGGLEEDDSLLDESMENLASQTKGKVPTSSEFFQSMRDVNGTFSYIGKALSDSASEIGSIASDFGKGSLSIIKFVSGNLPLILIAGVAGFVYFNRESFRFTKDQLMGALKK